MLAASPAPSEWQVRRKPPFTKGPSDDQNPRAPSPASRRTIINKHPICPASSAAPIGYPASSPARQRAVQPRGRDAQLMTREGPAMKLHSFQHYSHGLEMAVHDAWVTTKVRSALTFAESTRGLPIHVKTHAGMVTLSGRLNTHKQCEQAVSLTRGYTASPASMPATCRPICSPREACLKRPTPKRAANTLRRRRRRGTTNDQGEGLSVAPGGQRHAGFDSPFGGASGGSSAC
ncbi:Transport-associated domain [Pseudomonas chlororaphis subsp. chlororaphis]|nr:Transport-associated domain [Pseudomonas chlororaphis subsp. chlororaphis]